MYNALENTRKDLINFKEKHGEEATLSYVKKIEGMLTQFYKKEEVTREGALTIEETYLKAGLSKEFIVARLQDKNFNISEKQLDEKNKLDLNTLLGRVIAKICETK